MKRRTIKTALAGDLPRSHVREAVQAVHVRAKAPGSWEVRTLGTRGQTKRFSSREEAVSYAKQLPGAKSVVVYDGSEAVMMPVAAVRQSRAPSP